MLELHDPRRKRRRRSDRFLEPRRNERRDRLLKPRGHCFLEPRGHKRSDRLLESQHRERSNQRWFDGEQLCELNDDDGVHGGNHR